MLLVTQQIANCPITSKDLDVAEYVFGPDISTLKGKSTRRKTRFPKVEEIVSVPKELYEVQKEVELCMDFMYVNRIPFLVTISKRLMYRTCERVFKKGTKSESFNATLDNVLRIYNKAGFRITVIHADNEFEPYLLSLLMRLMMRPMKIPLLLN